MNWLHMSTGAEIETALCILESVLPTLASLRYKTRKLGIWEFVGPSCCDPRGVLGNSETRNLEFGSPSALDRRGGLGNSETRNLELGGRPLGSDPRGVLGNSETRLGNSESGIWESLCLGPKRACACWLGRRRANPIVRKWRRRSMSADTAIKAEKVTAAAKSSATFNAPRIYRA